MQCPYPITLDDEHRYWLNGREVPGVTSILEAAGLIDLKWVTQYALDRGTAVHDAILFEHEHDLDESTLDPVVLPYLEQYRRFVTMTGAKVVQAERIVYSALKDYAGRFDLLLSLNGQQMVIDIKCNKAPKHVNAQVGGYSFALTEAGTVVHRVGCLELTPKDFSLNTWEPLLAQSEWFRVLAKARGLAA